MYRRIIAVFMAVMVVATTCAVPSFATDYQSKYNFWNWAYDNSWFLGKLITGSADNVCSVSEDTLHHSTNHQKGDTVDGEQQYTCICDDCGQTFNAVATDLENSFGAPDYKVKSDGTIILSGSFRATQAKSDCTAIVSDVYDNGFGYTVTVSCTRTSYNPHQVCLYYDFVAPYDCTLAFDSVMSCIKFFATEYTNINSSVILSGSSVIDIAKNTAAFPVLLNVSGGVAYSLRSEVILATTGPTSASLVFDVPYVRVFNANVDTNNIPVSGGGSISYTDDNSNNKIYDAEFMDFSTNEYHNPVTDYSTKVDNWTYDYSTRTFTGCTQDGDVKIVYGDEYMSVTENGNIYNYYYSSGSGSGSDGDSSGDDDGDGLFGKIGELLGTLLGGLLDLVTGVLSGILDSLISLVEMTIEKLGSVVNLFGSFGDALRALWSWLPEDIITILSAGVSVVIFAAVLKLFI